VNRQAGVVTAFVRSVDDPAGEGRVGLEFPWLPGGDALPTTFAPVAAPLAGADRGVFFQPEVGDEVLVAFDRGDWDHPYIVGYLWNGSDTPPETDRQNRVIVTPGGHTLRFEDGNPKKVILRSNGGHEITLDDAGGTVAIKTSGGQQITLNDMPPAIEVTTSLGTEVSIDGASGVTVTAPTGELTINCLQATINASLLNVNAPLARFSGVLQASTVITSSVVSSSYTPGAGNIW
jgi:uncharacterized protein involved in type VI secretion and phage assembly